MVLLAVAVALVVQTARIRARASASSAALSDTTSMSSRIGSQASLPAARRMTAFELMAESDTWGADGIDIQRRMTAFEQFIEETEEDDLGSEQAGTQDGGVENQPEWDDTEVEIATLSPPELQLRAQSGRTSHVL